MTSYIYQLPGWPAFQWDTGLLDQSLASVRHRQGRLIGRMEALGFSLQAEAMLSALTQEVVTSSEIEGEILDHDQVRSSIARHLGIEIGALAPADRRVDGVVEMTLDATQQYRAPLTVERLSTWHAGLFPVAPTAKRRLIVGAWRDDREGPMQVVSGSIGRERVHYQAPPAEQVAVEMQRFLEWFNNGAALDWVLKAALSHLWFVTIHPFEDGNGRIARAIADLALARSDDSRQRFYSMSAQIRQERKHYYDILERTQHGDLDITPWLVWFVGCLDRAIGGVEATLGEVLRKARFWATHAHETLNPRQRMVVNRILDGFDGKLTTSKWARLSKTSADTALRDINDLVARGILVREKAGGRSTSYLLKDGA